MKLRKLELKDAPFMLEWMHDKIVTEKLATNFKEKTLYDCENFIKQSLNDDRNIHLAIVSEDDEYMGTVSLKHINYNKSFAEFAISVRSKAMGKGYSWYGMSTIIKKAFDEYNLSKVYWCVSIDNKKARRFYDKHKFPIISDVEKELLDLYDNSNLIWYALDKNDDFFKRIISDNKLFKIVNIRTIKAGDNLGELSYVESNNDIPFDIKRIYYITKVSEGIRRGFHAHKNLKQLLFCPYGEINLVLDDGDVREEMLLNDSGMGVLIEKPLWREMVWIHSDSVLCVLASEYYDVDDYIRDYDEFKKYVRKQGKI